MSSKYLYKITFLRDTSSSNEKHCTHMKIYIKINKNKYIDKKHPLKRKVPENRFKSKAHTCHLIT